MSPEIDPPMTHDQKEFFLGMTVFDGTPLSPRAIITSPETHDAHTFERRSPRGGLAGYSHWLVPKGFERLPESFDYQKYAGGVGVTKICYYISCLYSSEEALIRGKTKLRMEQCLRDLRMVAKVMERYGDNNGSTAESIRAALSILQE